MHLGRQHEAGQGDGFEVVVERARLGPVHRRAGLGQEVLDDHLLHVAVAAVGIGDGLERGEPIGPVLADPDEDAGGERDAETAGGVEGGQATLGQLVGRPVVGGQVGPQRLDHHPLAGGDRPEGGQLVVEQGAGVGVGQQARLVEHQAAHGRQVVDRGGVPVVGQPLGRRGVALFRPFAEGEQRLVAPRRGPGAGDRQHLVGRQVGRREPGGRLGERAVPTPVATQHRQRDEDLGRVGDPGAGGGVAHPARLTHQHVERQVEQVGVPHPRRDYRRAGTTLTGAASGRAAAEPRGVLVMPARRPRRPARRRAGRRSPSGRRGPGAPPCPRRASGPPRRPPAGRSRTRPAP